MQCLGKRELIWIYIVLIAALVINLILLGLVVTIILSPILFPEPNDSHENGYPDRMEQTSIIPQLTASGSHIIATHVLLAVNGKRPILKHPGNFADQMDLPGMKKIIYINRT